MPNAIDHHAGREWITGTGDSLCQLRASASSAAELLFGSRERLKISPRGRLAGLEAIAADENRLLAAWPAVGHAGHDLRRCQSGLDLTIFFCQRRDARRHTGAIAQQAAAHQRIEP